MSSIKSFSEKIKYNLLHPFRVMEYHYKKEKEENLKRSIEYCCVREIEGCFSSYINNNYDKCRDKNYYHKCYILSDEDFEKIYKSYNTENLYDYEDK
jgi:hypothetical protein